ncbi:hypothetical protein [uncultured Massilia sp.]|uniref:hypothetical protein n=1 Tax=uncultured Massilia sp. TaxID=169973 RepID=UPI0025FBAA43|nr:hypothetical protein [uncultured Massilia sp.]
MQIEKRQRCILSPAQAVTSRDARVAREHAAIFPTRLALARWTRGGDIPHVFASDNQPLRAAWYAQAQRGFQGWLESGGFHQCTAALATVDAQDGGSDHPPARGGK